ncbi:uncharacterized mitochondrial protein AtMg00810-like [Arachis stenosperma]|uniref:uncharacterized mitochondrial protein AtMg00810-like n=1 Tax=Arachis stenosperma TaxID=217475 RepID=UPI0025AD7CEA|nr:uncharacterized mitochondrial protein AtMg00810-like [Arachis stenosperma]
MSTTYLLAYVDDILVTGISATEIESLIQQLHAVFTLKDLGEMSFFLGVEVVRDSPDSLLLKQSKYIKELLGKANIPDAKPVPTSMLNSPKLTGLQYATITRPEIAYSVSKVSQYMHAPSDLHWKAVKRILRYLDGTIDLGLQIHKSDTLRIMAFSDSDWATDTDGRKSVSGYCVFLGTNLVTWSSRKQRTVSRSSTEAEFWALADAMTDTIWLQKLLLEMRLPPGPAPTMFCDNQSTVLMTRNPVLHSRSKYFEIDLHFVRNIVVQQLAHVVHIPSQDQFADILTKLLS